ncbi:unnamed protein product [Timema podura]|uniref:Uncharacterized protein n=1 Tax=Timema podura TaxID=61482 RepID=A0ABN7NYV0_TIMPD|nr:unnamed protein product [Timema podura]
MLKIRTELDMPIKSEVVLTGEVLDNQQIEHGTNSTLIPTIKEELDEIDVPIKSKAKPACSRYSNFSIQFAFSQTKYKEESTSAVQCKRKRAKCKEKSCCKCALKRGKCAKFGGIQFKSRCTEGCSKYPKVGEKLNVGNVEKPSTSLNLQKDVLNTLRVETKPDGSG